MKHSPIINQRSTTMFGRFREIVAMFIRRSGVALVIRKTICRRRATIVVYHDPTPQYLESHLKFLGKRHTFVSLSTLVEALRQDQWEEIPNQALVVTVDDGHKGNSQLLHVFRKYGVSPTIFACSHLVGTHRHFWWTDAGSIAATVKRMPTRDALVLLDRETGYFPEREYGTRVALNGDELRALVSHAEIGSHTCNHPILVNCDDEDCWMEISRSKTRLEELLKTGVTHFSYPNGDYTQREATMVAKRGYLSARTLDVGWVSRKADPLRLKAICVQDDASVNVLCAQVSGIFQYLHYVRDGRWSGRRPLGVS